MPHRQTTNVSLSAHQKGFIQSLVASGRYRTASEAMRDAVRLLEEAEHRRLLEKWIYEGLSDEEDEQVPQALKERAKAYFQGLVDEAMNDVEDRRLKDGPTAMKRLRDELEARSG